MVRVANKAAPVAHNLDQVVNRGLAGDLLTINAKRLAKITTCDQKGTTINEAGYYAFMTINKWELMCRLSGALSTCVIELKAARLIIGNLVRLISAT